MCVCLGPPYVCVCVCVCLGSPYICVCIIYGCVYVCVCVSGVGCLGREGRQPSFKEILRLSCLRPIDGTLTLSTGGSAAAEKVTSEACCPEPVCLVTIPTDAPGDRRPGLPAPSHSAWTGCVPQTVWALSTDSQLT